MISLGDGGSGIGEKCLLAIRLISRSESSGGLIIVGLITAGYAKSQPLQWLKGSLLKENSEKTPGKCHVVVEIGVGGGAVVIGQAVKYTSGITQRATIDIAVQFRSDATIGHQVIRQRTLV